MTINPGLNGNIHKTATSYVRLVCEIPADRDEKMRCYGSLRGKAAGLTKTKNDHEAREPYSLCVKQNTGVDGHN